MHNTIKRNGKKESKQLLFSLQGHSVLVYFINILILSNRRYLDKK